MTSHITATVVDGEFKLDEPLQLAEQTRFRLTIEPFGDRLDSSEAWEALRAWIVQNSRHGLGRRLSREEHYERH